MNSTRAAATFFGSNLFQMLGCPRGGDAFGRAGGRTGPMLPSPPLLRTPPRLYFSSASRPRHARHARSGRADEPPPDYGGDESDGGEHHVVGGDLVAGLVFEPQYIHADPEHGRATDGNHDEGD